MIGPGDDDDDDSDFDDLASVDDEPVGRPVDDLPSPDVDVDLDDGPDDDPLDMSTVDDTPGDDWEADGPVPIAPADEQPAPMQASNLPILPWSTRATLLDLALDLPAILDPTRADSEWVLAEAPARSRGARG